MQTSLRMSSYEPPILAYSVGLVVTPSSTPQRATVRISSMSAVSRKIFMAGRLQGLRCVATSLRSLGSANLQNVSAMARRTVVSGPIARAARTARIATAT